MKISDYLSEGRENAKTGRELAALLRCDIRTITELIEQARREGEPICASSQSDNPGYYMAEDAADLEAYCERLKGRCMELFWTLRALMVTLDQWAGEGG